MSLPPERRASATPECHAGVARSNSNSVGDWWEVDGVGEVRMVGSAGAAPGLNIGGGFLKAARERATNGSVTRVVAMVIRCCCGQVSTFRGGVGRCQERKAP